MEGYNVDTYYSPDVNDLPDDASNQYDSQHDLQSDVSFGETVIFPDGTHVDNPYQDHLNQVYKTRSDYITGNDPHTLDGSGSATPTFSGYRNSDGTYHWDSDNTDRDPQTGAIVRRW
jgi:hypothetical protein